MSFSLSQSQPDLTLVETRILDTRPGAVLLEESPYYPGGGGQLPDRCRIFGQSSEAEVTGASGGLGNALWHHIDSDVDFGSDVVRVEVDPTFRALMCEIHTGLHVLNALVYRAFEGALVTGVQMAEDGKARIDFDLPDVDNDRLRALEPEMGEVIRQGLAVRQELVSAEQLAAEPGLIRSKAVVPPPLDDGGIRVVEIVGLDRQACGGTHLKSTDESRPLRIAKIKNKGRHNRRVYLAVGP